MVQKGQPDNCTNEHAAGAHLDRVRIVSSMAQLSEYELERLRTIATNGARLAEIMGEDPLDFKVYRTKRRTLSAEEVERRSAAGAALQKSRLANQRPTSQRLVLLAASTAERNASSVASIYDSPAALDALEREGPKKKLVVRQHPESAGLVEPQLAPPLESGTQDCGPGATQRAPAGRRSGSTCPLCQRRAYCDLHADAAPRMHCGG